MLNLEKLDTDDIETSETPDADAGDDTALPAMTLPDDRPRRDVQRGKQRRRAVPSL
jgi:hypothetical protein